MFTGIIETIGKVLEIEPVNAGLKLIIQSSIKNSKLKKGTSIAVNGVCLTVEKSSDMTKSFQLSLIPETIKLTTFKDIRKGDLVNLEQSLTLSTVLAGHMVLGHVDFTGSVLKTSPHLKISIPSSYAKYFPVKGSVCLNGVSLTISASGEDWLLVELIPETIRSTNLGKLKARSPINVEIDVLARYAEHLLRKI